MKKIFLKAYFNKNIGDDIFIKILTDRYKENFITVTNYNYLNISNICIKRQNLFMKIINKFIKFISNNKFSYEKLIMNKCDFVILIGGSIFIENEKQKYNLYLGKKYFIVGANFGPYKTKRYLDDIYKVFLNAEDVCVRDKYTYELFSNINKVRYAPDLLFTLDLKKYIVDSDNIVVFSIIDCEKKASKIYENNYINLIVQMIQKFQDMNYKIILMSFCKNEGDEEGINKVYKKLCDTKNITNYFYDGNIDEALYILGKSKIIVGSRFHANIIGIKMNKIIVPIAYSNKTIDVLNDINYSGIIYDIRKLDGNEEFNIDNNRVLIENIQKISENATMHFSKIDEILEKR